MLFVLEKVRIDSAETLSELRLLPVVGCDGSELFQQAELPHSKF
jgi:hypothetical protein